MSRRAMIRADREAFFSQLPTVFYAVTDPAYDDDLNSLSFAFVHGPSNSREECTLAIGEEYPRGSTLFSPSGSKEYRGSIVDIMTRAQTEFMSRVAPPPPRLAPGEMSISGSTGEPSLERELTAMSQMTDPDSDTHGDIWDHEERMRIQDNPQFLRDCAAFTRHFPRARLQVLEEVSLGHSVIEMGLPVRGLDYRRATSWGIDTRAELIVMLGVTSHYLSVVTPPTVELRQNSEEQFRLRHQLTSITKLLLEEHWADLRNSTAQGPRASSLAAALSGKAAASWQDLMENTGVMNRKEEFQKAHRAFVQAQAPSREYLVNTSEGLLVMVAEYLAQRLPSLNAHCIICDQEHGSAPEGPAVCARELCCFSYQQLGIGQSAGAQIVGGAIDPLDLLSIQILTDQQTRALQSVQKYARQRSMEAMPALQARCAAYGDQDTVQAVLRYIRDKAPITIHVSHDVIINFLLKDTHYRNQFETNTSKGTLSHPTRVGWEDGMFAGIYHDTIPFDRVKYGSLNIVNDPAGVKSAYHYGDCYLQLKGVRLRTTFAGGDTGCSSNHTLAMCEYYAHICTGFNESELKCLCEVATGKVTHHDSSCFSQYKEVQIHGPIELSKHVEALVVPTSFRTSAQLPKLQEFCDKNNCQLWFFDRLG
eukprot:gnl/Spiro4/17451_TR9283_c0_g2_i1.p1 gnl/Spiro4/17451_TR9283_c0_g2~~gnl/Spiro4/17451_TR9283_c0_g2_i1.p1  ORF type:complete len:648 (+),score=226.29 gnl/Spiro4/17451_TR9283_c0_g2_i1:88-2031(+)